MNKLKLVESTLSCTMSKMSNVVGRISMRGLEITEIEQDSEKLLESSNEFVHYFIPWYKRLWYNLQCCPKWWCSSSCRRQEEQIDRMEWIEV